MVSLTVERRLRAQAEAERTDAIVAAFRAAVASLPTRDDPLLDRLFALECLLQAGREARVAAQELLPARRDAEWQIEQEWEPDVPHLAILGQAISVLDATGEHPPTDWVQQLTATTAELAVRRTRFSLATSPALLAPVLRGMAVTRLTPPSELLNHIRSYLGTSPDPIVAAQLAEALCRYRSNNDLAKQAMIATFSSPKESVEAAVARWWLVERWQALRAEPVPVKASDIEEARTQVLSMPVSLGSPALAMLAETTGRHLGRLVIVSLTALSEIREGLRLRTLVENLAWRVLFAWSLVALALVHLRTAVGWFPPFQGSGHPSVEVLRTVAAAIVAIAAAITAVEVRSGYRKLGRQEPAFLDLLTVALPAVGGVLAFALYP